MTFNFHEELEKNLVSLKEIKHFIKYDHQEEKGFIAKDNLEFIAGRLRQELIKRRCDGCDCTFEKCSNLEAPAIACCPECNHIISERIINSALGKKEEKNTGKTIISIERATKLPSQIIEEAYAERDRKEADKQ